MQSKAQKSGPPQLRYRILWVHPHFPWFKLKIGLAIFNHLVYMLCQEVAPHKVTMNHIMKREARERRKKAEALGLLRGETKMFCPL
jgi:hypothetical protein